ncbi:sensor histidine kinase [Streptococcus salivarius]|nr:GHKL domain-containing protein [Streptococcus salivarius]
MSMIIPTLLSFLLIGFFKQSFKFLKNQRPNTKSQRTIKTTNFLLIIYFIIQHSLVYVEEFTHSSTLDLRKFIVIIYTILFFLMLIFLDRTTRDIMQEELNLQNNIRLKNLDTYNHKIEELYQTVRGFRHNYRNLLTTLKLGIDQEDMTIVKDIYTSILETSDKRLETKQFDLTQLINIQDNTLKSLLSAKFLQADDQNIDISLEIPSPITLEGMTILDFITVISILIDNAMEATVKAKKTKIMIAYIKQDKYQRFIIKNSTKEESISITKIFQKGFSSKGTDRGIGLASIREILEYYPNVSLNTRSVAYEFTQDLIIRQKT